MAEYEQEILDSLDLSELEQIGAKSGLDVGSLIRSLLSGTLEEEFSVTAFLRQALSQTLADFRRVGAALLTPMIVSALLGTLLGRGAGSGRAIQLICRVCCVSALTAAFAGLCDVARGLIERVLQCSDAMVPAMITAAALSGAETGASMLTPLSAICTDLIQNIVGEWGITLSMAMAGVAIAGNLSDAVQLGRLHGLIRQVMQWGIGILMTVYTGMIAIQGRMASGRDTAVTRAARFTIESVIPVVGGDVSNSLDSILSTASVIRNALGATGLIVLAAACLVPLGRLAGMSLLLKLTAAISEPLGEKTLTSLTLQFSEAVEMLLVSAVTALLLCAILVGGCMTAAGAVVR